MTPKEFAARVTGKKIRWHNWHPDSYVIFVNRSIERYFEGEAYNVSEKQNGRKYTFRINDGLSPEDWIIVGDVEPDIVFSAGLVSKNG